MKHIKNQDIEYIAKELDAKKVVVLPTDTIYGLSCLATSKKAVDKMYTVKKRPKDMKFIVLVKSYCMLHDYFYVSKKQDTYIRSIWPRTTREAHNFGTKSSRPTTFILKQRGKLAPQLGEDGEAVAVRLPKHELLIDILKKLNKPIISTSLNISGEEPIQDLSEIEQKFCTLPDLVVDAVKSRRTKASRIIDIRDMGGVRVIRG